ncbi:hypothetical protein EYF80_043871 [Liparis tanakae]|uniref:Uncharacterized protein n=1 Tax=Liparis tanakae TaxID=230148 RepID=A0A4Z2G045_9TELE|nr:hypothetical protein EYF80_043871 [Liparis tanakae]
MPDTSCTGTQCSGRLLRELQPDHFDPGQPPIKSFRPHGVWTVLPVGKRNEQLLPCLIPQKHASAA